MLYWIHLNSLIIWNACSSSIIFSAHIASLVFNVAFLMKQPYVDKKYLWHRNRVGLTQLQGGTEIVIHLRLHLSSPTTPALAALSCVFLHMPSRYPGLHLLFLVLISAKSPGPTLLWMVHSEVTSHLSGPSSVLSRSQWVSADLSRTGYTWSCVTCWLFLKSEAWEIFTKNRELYNQ